MRILNSCVGNSSWQSYDFQEASRVVAVVMLCSLVWFPRIAKRVARGGVAATAVTVYRLDWLLL